MMKVNDFFYCGLCGTGFTGADGQYCPVCGQMLYEAYIALKKRDKNEDESLE